MKQIPIALIKILQDGQFHSGEAIAKQMNMSRSAICRQVQVLREIGLAIDAVTGRGYRIQQTVELLNEDAIQQGLKPSIADMLAIVDVRVQVDSTNSCLQRISSVDKKQGHLLLAEHQLEGRGRRGKAWFSPFASSVYYSLQWRFQRGPVSLAALSLAVGSVLYHWLQTLNFPGLWLKWPNDIYVDEKKLAGILIEVSGEVEGPCWAVIGIGINVNLSGSETSIKGVEITDLASHVAGLPGRNRLVAEFSNHLLPALRQFDHEGFAGFHQQWQKADGLTGKMVEVTGNQPTYQARCLGVDLNGSLRLQRGNEQFVVNSGNSSIRRL